MVAPAVAGELSPLGIRNDSLEIADVYGFAPAFFVPTPTTVIYEAVNPTPGTVTAVAKLVRTLPNGRHASPFFDRYV